MNISQNQNEFAHDDLCLAIDLGTTNSVVSVVTVKPNGNIVCKVVEIPRPVDMYNALSGDVRLTQEKKATLPSCIYYRQERSYEPIVGDFAKRQYSLRPHLVAKSIKSQMGNSFTEGLAVDVPDKTPAEVSARILKHIIGYVSKVYGGKSQKYITDAVITVPANFDSAMCKATRDAAELAGIKVRNEDGSERPILLSEPNAVLYDLVNQIQNGEISDRIIDLSTKKTVLVFDLGGGTLDITMHEISRRDDAPDVLKVNEIATNRYTLLGGDDFDEAIAQAMFLRYQKQWSGNKAATEKIARESKVVMARMRLFAENLKMDLNERCSGESDYISAWDMIDDDDISIDVGGNMDGTGYSYEDQFTKSEIESILSEFMANQLSFDDYKKVDDICDTRNIIYPILDVLNKASVKLANDFVNVDYVIVNGGMSKFYMVTDRLKTFFGFDPIVALDPDQSVARGAAVYHHYLHKYDDLLKNDMKTIGDVAKTTPTNAGVTAEKPTVSVKKPEVPKTTGMAIEWGKSILNDALYLGLKNGNVHELIPTGAELPYVSEIMKGFRMEPGQAFISLPIKSKNLDGKTYRKIASGNITFHRGNRNGCFVAFRVYMGTNKVITMQAWKSDDENGANIIEEGTVEIAIDNVDKIGRTSTTVTAPGGTSLDPVSELFSLIQMCQNYEKKKNQQRTQSAIAKDIAFAVESICKASNNKDFADPILNKLERSDIGAEAKQRLFTIARKLGSSWTNDQKTALSRACFAQLQPDFYGWSRKGAEITATIQAIYTLSMCATPKQIESLVTLHGNGKYQQACLYTHAKTKTCLSWIYSKFTKDAEDIKSFRKGASGTLQSTAYSIGVALRKDGNDDVIFSAPELKKLVQNLCSVISTGRLTFEELMSCLLALGWICDRRQGTSDIQDAQISNVSRLIEDLSIFYDDSFIERCARMRIVVRKMIDGKTLEFDDEQYLLEKLEI